MRHLGFVEDEAIFEFTRISCDHPIADDDVFANVASAADFAVVTDPSRTFDHGTLLDDGIFSHENSRTDKWFADEFAVQSGLEAELEVGRNFWQNVPDILYVFKERAVLAVAEVKKFFNGKHSINVLRRLSAPGSVSGLPWCL